MGEYRIRGGLPVRGQIKVEGAKNAVLPILAATVLNGGTSVIHNCPDISDTFVTLEILKALGCGVNYENNTITVDSSTLCSARVPDELVRRMRSSVIFMGSLLGRLGEAVLGYPGGCELGARPIDFHLKAFRQMGAVIMEGHGELTCSAAKLTGKRITLDLPSVGATENIMLAAVLAQGETIIMNAAREPEVYDLQTFLLAMGAKIKGAGTDTIVIQGVEKLHDAEHTIIGDRIVAGTYLTAAAITRGEIQIDGINPDHISPVYARLSEMGCTVRESGDGIYLKASKRPCALDRLTTMPHPGFPTDMQPQFMALMCVSKGSCIMNETVFEARNKHVAELKRMGADIILLQNGTTAFVRGLSTLKGAVVEAKDLRGGAALILAGLFAEGETIVKNSSHVERGYVMIEKQLENLGCDVVFEPMSTD